MTPCFPFVYCVTQTIKLTYYHHNFFRESLRFEIPQLQYSLDSSIHNLRIVLDKRMVTKPCLSSWIIFWGAAFSDNLSETKFPSEQFTIDFPFFITVTKPKKKNPKCSIFKKKHTHSNTQSYQIHIHTFFSTKKSISSHERRFF